MNGFELAALYTLQHRLACDAEFHCGFEHGQELWRCFLNKARTQFVGYSNAPGCAWSNLFSGNKAIVNPSVNRGCRHTKDFGCVFESDKFSCWSLSRRLVARNVAITAQAANLIRSEAFAVSSFASLTIQNAGDDVVGVMGGKATKQGECIFVGANSMRLRMRQGEIELSESTASPA